MKDFSKTTDEQVVDLVRKQKKEYFAEIMNRYQVKLLRYAERLIGDEHKAEDAVQNAFIKAYMNLNGFNVNKKFSSWIYRIVHNEAMNLINKDKKQLPLDERVEFDSGVDIEEDLIIKETKEEVDACLDKMSRIYAEPLSLFYLEEKSYEEIGDILRLPVGTVGTRVSRAKKLMKRLCQKQK